jgi:hypothetical protein
VNGGGAYDCIIAVGNCADRVAYDWALVPTVWRLRPFCFLIGQQIFWKLEDDLNTVYNFYENTLVVYGQLKDLRRFARAARGDACCLAFDNFIPVPVQFKNQDKISKLWVEEMIDEAVRNGTVSTEQDEFSLWLFFSNFGMAPREGLDAGGKEWRLKNWGTTSDPLCRRVVRKVMDKKGYGLLMYAFGTAYSPPEPVIRRMGQMFPELWFVLTYYVTGEQLEGLLFIQQGEVVIG